MKIITIIDLPIPEIKIIRFARFKDNRGYFSEHFRQSDFNNIDFLTGFNILQCNESYSHKYVARGLHFQWNPYMGKLVRTIEGHMFDVVLDIRIGSPTYGKAIMYDMPVNENSDYVDWIWIPPGFAHGNLYLEDSKIEYFCTGQYNPNCEAGINILSPDIDWSLCDERLYRTFEDIKQQLIISDKDKNGFTLSQWGKDLRSQNFKFTPFVKKTIIVTGGSGLLGSKLRELLTDADFPTSSEFDITDYNNMLKFMEKRRYSILLHCAAFTPPPKVEKDPIKGIEVNIVGTCNIVKLCQQYNMKLVYISTDYVFDGKKGNYVETDPVLPVNKYAWSKLGGECAVNMYDNHLILRLSFGPDEFPYSKAFYDQYTSRLPVSQIAKQIVTALTLPYKGTLHLGTTRRSVYEYAKSISPEKEIDTISIKDISLKLPEDTSLDTSLFMKFINVNNKN